MTELKDCICDLDAQDRAEAAEAKVARVEALAAEWEAQDRDEIELDREAGIFWHPHVEAKRLRAALDGDS